MAFGENNKRVLDSLVKPSWEQTKATIEHLLSLFWLKAPTRSYIKLHRASFSCSTFSSFVESLFDEDIDGLCLLCMHSCSGFNPCCSLKEDACDIYKGLNYLTSSHTQPLSLSFSLSPPPHELLPLMGWPKSVKKQYCRNAILHHLDWIHLRLIYETV